VKTAALILAAGSGARAPGPVPKQYRPLGVGSAVARSVEVMLAQPDIDLVQVVIAAGDRPLYDAALPAPATARLLAPVSGGATRQQSALQGLLALSQHAPERVLIHDSARPFVTARGEGHHGEARQENADGVFGASRHASVSSNRHVARSRAGPSRVGGPEAPAREA